MTGLNNSSTISLRSKNTSHLSSWCGILSPIIYGSNLTKHHVWVAVCLIFTSDFSQTIEDGLFEASTDLVKISITNSNVCHKNKTKLAEVVKCAHNNIHYYNSWHSVMMRLCQTTIHICVLSADIEYCTNENNTFVKDRPSQS